MVAVRAIRRTFVLVLSLLAAVPAAAQQTGEMSGKVTDTSGGVLPGVTVEARSDVLPSARVAVTEAVGEYRLPALPPGNYTVTFTLSGMQTVTRQAQVQLGQDTVVNAAMGVQALNETVNVTATVSLIERDSASLKSGVSNEQIMSLPVGQEYRDLLKLIPGVQYSQDTVRGPSAGGSGQDNVYNFDGVNVTLPLFGTLASEPSSHDIAQVTTVRGGARAVDFDRSGGFTIDSVSKSGTNRFTGELSWQVMSQNMVAALQRTSASRYEQDRNWLTVNAGGPVIRNKLNFYGSYYRPQNTRENRANRYGELPDYERTRDEGFAKLTFTPTSSVLLNFSYRDSHRLDTSDLFASTASATTGTGNEAWQKIGTLEGSWVINSRSHLTFRYTDYTNETQGRPDNIASVSASTDIGTRLDVGRLDQIGLLTVPVPVTGQTAFNDFVQPLIDRYGYIDNGVNVGGGTVGYGTTFDEDNFFRKAGQIAYNINLGGALKHDLHFGYQRYVDAEDLIRSSNGWGSITVPGGRLSFNGTPIFYTAAFQQQGLGLVPKIHSEYQSQSFEANDTIRWRDWTFNAGIVASNDTLFGQGLQEDSSKPLTGFVAKPGVKYEMYDIPFTRMIQPRLATTWAYNSRDTVFASYATYNPAASSLPRAASWDRNLATTINSHFDASGVLFGSTNVASSSGKLFVEDMTPRTVDELMIGTARLVDNRWSTRVYYRYRKATHFWEDTNNNARTAFRSASTPASVPATLYIEDLTQRLAEITSGSSYVIAELDGAFTKYHEATVESEWRNDKVFVRGSYTWSHYYGNFDQDNSTTANDANVFVGSSFIGDGAGRQLWDFREGDMRGDRRHMVKLYGYYTLKWDAVVGAYAFAQSGQPWETWSYEPYIALTTNTADTSRYAEAAGSRHTNPHAQLDLKYTQNFRLGGRTRLQVDADLFNVFNGQTGYNPQPGVHTGVSFGVSRNFYDPRRFQIAARLRF
jgi:Carboxypeptidase regulatory-like domain